ncbi:MAG: pseudouridine synthase [Solimonas sp.]
MRLNKYISETGLCSRREADVLIAAGRVTINGRPVELGQQVGEADEVCVDGKPVKGRLRGAGHATQRVYIALNKPAGITCTTERHVAGNIVDFVGHAERIFPIGRLDKDSDGLILLTSNGDIVNEILRLENGHEKEYIVTIDRPVTPEFVRGMAAGVWLPELNVRTRPCRVEKMAGSTFRIVLMQGLNRQIRRMCEVFDCKVRRLQRVRIVNIRLGDLKPGQWRDLGEAELRGLLPERTIW